MRLLRGVLLVATAFWCGCDALQESPTDEGRFRFVLSTLHSNEQAGSLNGCATSIRTVAFSVNGLHFREDVEQDTIVFAVSNLSKGELHAEAAILSNRGDTLFVGDDRRNIDANDFGTIDIRLQKIRPVLEICPDTLDLHEQNDYSGTFTVVNRDARPTGTHADTLLWRAVEPRVCIDELCVVVRPDVGATIAPRSQLVFVGSGFAPSGTLFPITFESAYGEVTVYARVPDNSLD